MAGNWNLPTNTSDYLDVLAEINNRLDDSANMFADGAATNLTTGFMRFNHISGRFERYDSGWSARLLAIEGGGTGASSISGAQSALQVPSVTTLDNHTTNTTTPHGATASPTANTLVIRDASGRSAIAAPSATDDIARLDTVTGRIATHYAVMASGSATGHMSTAHYTAVANLATNYVRTGAASVISAGSLRFNDNVELYLGSSNDVTSIWNGTNYITTLLTGAAYLRLDGIYYIQNEAGTSTNFTFTSEGDLTARGDITAYSDRRLKDNIRAISHPMQKVKQLTGCTFVRKDTGQVGTGLIAQDVQAVLPEAVHTAEDGTLSIAYGNTVGLLVEAIKSLEARIATLEGV